ncbi:DUF4221 family protein [Cyclobacterium plantarum]|uniref:DUF4221 family protein n=1 Tax=Cyclobacterium plantarum TaxID=2716263 RepID=A0ABX0H853_9BACT|nr:DUF4221 family protein [Cyclobacterium plantarum]NHE56539.1 DUF4221 family protein [Cyclobacterium plantarum]
MKNYVIVIGLLVIFGCSENKSKSEVEPNFKLTQDTVVIDPIGGIINLKDGLNSPELSKDGKYLYHYTDGEARFDKINLDNLELEETLQFEKEGPNGMGSYIGGYALTAGNQLMIWSYGLNALFDQGGQKVRDLKLTKIAQELQGSEIFPLRLMEHPTDTNRIFGLYVKWQDYQYFMMKFDLEIESYEKVPLPETEKLHEFRMDIQHNGRPAGGFGPKPRLTNFQDKIVLTNSAYNEAYVYDIPLDSLYLISWSSELTGNQNEYKLPKTVELDQAGEHSRKYMEAINFMEPKWDPVSQRYIRLSYKTKFGEELNEFGEAEETGAEVFLTVLDKSLNIIKETFLDRYEKRPPPHFFIDNKIWLYENIADELGFVRITVD